ncbi:hypothetical protein H7J77_16810 [Mycolicibacillus parakoreensis]|uniref:Uncharacterized protein n=1 Tax=Mycolicibacillus parakoreensis TaxID=1069221 RepID=A0ABY3TUX9_9MYCO|nr:hypothetical protein [Mycolicibacillus parakoreensis]MCV7317197.1 hypothetical protein [Mycolicibacillus parakoreensis]ULN51513.1 hypothetical protein MIU77_11405 [Mycolicibacillus parakoreensis]
MNTPALPAGARWISEWERTDDGEATRIFTFPAKQIGPTQAKGNAPIDVKLGGEMASDGSIVWHVGITAESEMITVTLHQGLELARALDRALEDAIDATPGQGWVQ